MNCKLVTHFHPDFSLVFWRISLRNTHVDEMPRRRRNEPLCTAKVLLLTKRACAFESPGISKYISNEV